MAIPDNKPPLEETIPSFSGKIGMVYPWRLSHCLEDETIIRRLHVKREKQFRLFGEL
jgi:hypothetical protein